MEIPRADAPLLRVTDLKQWIYCCRIPYWTYLMPIEKRIPHKMAFGADDHEWIAHLEGRRSLKSYGVTEGKRSFRIRLNSSAWGLTGILDAMVETPEERIPVEYKDTLGGVRRNHRIQLAAYALLLRELPGPPVKRGVVFVIPENRAHSVRFSAQLEADVREAMASIRETLVDELMPPPADRWAKCRDCEYLRFCGDRYEAVSQEE